MMIVEDKIVIQASQELVWQVTIDVGSWPLWSPGMEKIVRKDSGDFKAGSSALIKQKLLPETRWVVTELTPNKCFSWQTKVLGIKMVATHTLIPCNSGATSILRIEILGWIPVIWPVIKKLIARALKEENWGLKNYCESL
ncbi:MAG: hypothetical protein HOH38_02805 [Nitrospinaceae bacterium]|jgi:hypothetical protein|nr:hypothetical protein [Nitrospinaceae bacterium]MBT6346882.1 hypothetical protein [Nitrospina sp.]